MVELKIYFTGKMKDVDFMVWVDKIKDEVLNKINLYEFCILDSSQKYLNYNLGFENAKLNFARNCYMILKSDIVVINFDGVDNLANFAEIFIAQGFNKPIIGFSSLEDKQKNEEIGKLVSNLCLNFNEFKDVLEKINLEIPKLNYVDCIDLINYYLDNFYSFDTYVNERI